MLFPILLLVVTATDNISFDLDPLFFQGVASVGAPELRVQRRGSRRLAGA